MSDQHCHRVLGHAGHPQVKTPYLDQLASEGTRCTQAICQNPICTPSRVSWLSGQYAHNHGYYGLSGPNPEGLPTVFGHFRQHGYTTMALGKIHCPEYWIEKDCDVFHETCGCSIDGRSAEYTAFLEERGATEREDHQRFREVNTQGQPLDGRASNASHEESQEGWLARKAVEEIQKAQEEGHPFFTFVSMPRPHQAYAPSQPFWDLYPEEEIELPPNADLDLEAAGKAPHLIRQAAYARSGAHAVFEPRTYEAQRRRKIRAYLGQVSEVDHAVGTILKGLEDLGLREDTIVIYSSDHGEYVYQFGISEKAPGICSDSVCRIPMIWRIPGILPEGAELHDLVESVDLVNTLCHYCGLPELETADGFDIHALLEGGGEPVRDVAVTEFAWSKSITDGRYRMVYYPDRHPVCTEEPGFFELYDLQEDPWEMNNLYRDPAHQEMYLQLKSQLLNWLISTTRPKTNLRAFQHTGPQWETRYKNSVNADGKFSPKRLPRSDQQCNYL